MDNSLQNAQVETDKVTNNIHSATAIHQEAEGVGEEGGHHIHLPSPSLWPLILSAAILVAIAGLLFMPDYPWITVVAIPFILLGILGWALEDPMASKKQPVLVYRETKLYSKFKLGQEVVDKQGQLIGQIRARFPHYILVQSGGLGLSAFYVPQSMTEGEIKDDVVRLTVSENELLAMGANRVPGDLYNAEPEAGVPHVTGVPLFASAPLSPAQTGHYNYGPNYPGINTDASGSYRRDDVTVRPQSFVAERRKKVYKTPPAPSQQTAVQN
jgi:hypothetical protein